MNNKQFTTSITLLGKLSNSQDQLAWNRFVEQYSPLIFSWCHRFGVQEKDAPDVTQEVMLKLLGAIKSFTYDPIKGSFRSWLKTITVNLIRDIQRKSKSADVGSGDSRILSLLNSIQDPKALNELGNLIEKQYESELLLQASENIESRVQPKTWKAYQLAANQQMSAKQIGKELGIPIADVYVAKSRVTKMLREEIKKLES